MDVLNPANWVKPRGYANGIAAEGRFIFVAGQIGCNAEGRLDSDDFVTQVRQALGNVVAVLASGGATPAHIARLTWYLLDKRQFMDNQPALSTIYRDLIGKHYPAMTLLQVSGLAEDRALVEIEATAVVPRA